MDILNSFLKEKQTKNQGKTPKYGMRKLSVGFVSCFLGCAIFLAPVGVHAEEATDTLVAPVETQADVKKPVEATEAPAVKNEPTAVEEKETAAEEKPEAEVQNVPAEEKNVSEEAPEAATLTNEEESVEADKVVDTSEIKVEEKTAAANESVAENEATKAANTKEESEAVEEEKAPEAKAEKVKTAMTEAEAVEENVSLLELSEETVPEAVSAEEKREAKDISNEVQSKYVALTEEGHKTKGTVKPDAGEAIGWEVFFTSPKGTIAGDYFTIDLSDNLSLKGIEPYHENEYPIEIDGKVVADGVRTDRSTIKYTFNENINDQRNVVVSVKGFAYIDKTKVPNNKKDEKISIALGDKVDEHTINVEYGDTYYTGENLNGMSQFTEFNPETGEYTQVFYINPDSKTITTSTRNWATGKVVAFIDGITPDGSKSDVNYTDKDTTVTVQKLPAGTKVPDAIIENPVETDEPTMVKTTFRDGGIEIVFADNSDDNLRSNNIDSPYIITVKSIAAPSKTGNNVYSRATFYGDGSKFHIMDNSIVTTKGDTEAQGDKIGYFIEHHVYKTKVDGVLQEDKTFTLHSNKMEGYDYNKYFTNKNVIDDFKFVKVDTDKLVENPVYNTDGTIARGNYEPGKTKEVTYIYVRDITSGKFQEHHIYQTVDEEGNVLTTDDTVHKDETKGIDEDSYKTSKIDREGYTLTEVKATNDESAKLGVKFDSKGAETTGNYVNGKKLEVTYIYQKKDAKPWTPIEETGKFQEHHIYITKDKDGKEINRDEVPGKVSGGTKDMTYTTGKKEKDGFKFVRTETPVEGPTFNEDGSEATGNFKPGVKQEITYVYEKTVNKPVEPSKPEEPSTPVNPTPNTPDEPTEWTPLEPVDPETPDTPAKEEPKNPEPQTPEEPAQPEQPAEPKPADEEVEKPAETKVEDEESIGATDPADREEEIDQPKNYKENEEDLEGKAPQTFDAGVAPYAGLAGLASGVFAYLESKKRRNK